MPSVFINEIHYDNASSDTGEAIEIAGPAGTDLSGWSLVLYNGNNGSSYNTVSLSGTIADQDNGFGTLSFAISGIQNGSPDGIALVDDNGVVVQFLSYEGSFAAVGGPADGMSSTDIGVSESTSSPVGESLQLTGSGQEYDDFTWASASADNFGSVNTGQSFSSTPQPGAFSIADASVDEGDTGTTDLTFTITRSGGSSGAATVDYTIALGSADSADLDAGTSLTGSINFADGQTEAVVTIPVSGDTDVETDETLSVTLSNPTGGTTIDQASATGTIVNDDVAAPLANVFINEIHYDNASGDVGEFVEIANPESVDLTGWTLVFYNGNNGQSYGSEDLSGSDIFTAISRSGIQNGAPDGVALVDNNGNVVQFLSYEGSFVAVGGPADGMTSTDIGVSETGSTLVGDSLQLTGTGSTYADFTWAEPADDTPGEANNGQTLMLPVDPVAFINEIHYDDASADEGEAIEIAGTAGLDLSAYTLVLYNGNNGTVYNTVALSGIIPDQDDGYGTVSFAIAGIQNGAPDGIALVDGDGEVVQFLSYEGTMVAVGGPADGMTSTDIGVAEGGGTLEGTSMQLVGAGTQYEDFTWTTGSAESFGAVNGSQDFATANPAGSLRIADLAAAEGDSGTTAFTFTVERTGGSSGAVSADYAVVLGSGSGFADAADFSGALTGTVSFADGETSATIAVSVNGDTDGEPDETFAVELTNATGGADIADGEAIGTIQNDDLATIAIYEIQGAGHRSPYEGQDVVTTGIVTVIDGNGFFIQDATGDGDDATSDGVFVYTGTAPTGVAVGDAVQVSATVTEYVPGSSADSLPLTELVAPSVVVLSSGNALPAATLIGPGGRTPPSENLEDDGFTSFDPATDGLDFYESLEGMLVTVDAPKVVAPTNQYGEIWTVAGEGAGATGLSDDGTIVIDGAAGAVGTNNSVGGDFNPERIQIDVDADTSGFGAPLVNPGDVLNDVTGVVNYSFGNYEVLATGQVTVASQDPLLSQSTALEGTSDQLTVATYNVLNLDPNDADGDTDVADGRFTMIAQDIGFALGAPDIVVLEEIQDSDGSVNSSVVSASLTLQMLADAIYAETGVLYSVLDNPFITDDANGGQPGGNIRVAFLYRDDRVDLDESSVSTIPTEGTSAFSGARLPLAADFTFNGETVTVIGNHFSSKSGSGPLQGAVQPSENGSEARRAAQADAVNDWVDSMLASDPDANILVTGDFNEFQFEEPMKILTGELELDGTTVTPGVGVLENLTYRLPAEERYSYIYEGNAQQIDHILVSEGMQADAEVDVVHLNTLTGRAASDHDPVVSRFTFGSALNPIEGTDGDDRLYGTAEDDLIQAGDGNDTVQGNDGDDVIRGGAGDDKLVGLNDNDTIYGGDDNDQLSGNEGDDVLYGEDGDDKMAGGNGADILVGGAGKDDMTGGAGNDTFVFLAVSDSGVGIPNADLIRDFAAGDLIDLSAIDAIVGAADDAFTLVSQFSNTAGELIVTNPFGNTYVTEGDVDGDGLADFTIVTINSGPLAAGDFAL